MPELSIVDLLYQLRALITHLLFAQLDLTAVLLPCGDTRPGACLALRLAAAAGVQWADFAVIRSKQIGTTCHRWLAPAGQGSFVLEIGALHSGDGLVVALVRLDLYAICFWRSQSGGGRW